jgi:nucleoside-triphosphatase THEP1
VRPEEGKLKPCPPKIFLTGKIGAGKSTIIKAVIYALRVPVGGFVTERVFAAPGAPRGPQTARPPGSDTSGVDTPGVGPRRGGRKITGFSIRDIATGRTAPVAHFDENGNLCPHPEGFETVGVEAVLSPLRDAPAGAVRLMVMDELGFLERDSPRFQDAVFKALRSPLPVLGTLKDWDDPESRSDSSSRHDTTGRRGAVSRCGSMRRDGSVNRQDSMRRGGSKRRPEPFLEKVKASGIRQLLVTEESRGGVEKEALRLLAAWGF